MKSAFELAMERLGEPIKELTEEQKAAISEVESKYKAKLAEAEIARDERIAKAGGDVQETEQTRQDYVVEVASINSRLERAKEEIRN